MVGKGDEITVVLVSAKHIAQHVPIYCVFDWTAQRYMTDPGEICGDTAKWHEQFKIHLHPAMDKVIKFEVRTVNGDAPIGKVQIDLSLLKAGRSDAWYKMSRLDNQLAFPDAAMRIQLTKNTKTEAPPLTVSSVLPMMGNSEVSHADEEYVAGLTPEERRAFYDQKGLVAAWKNDDEVISDDGEEIPTPSGKNIPKFWELKNMFPGLEDRQLHVALYRNDYDLDETIEYLQKKSHKGVRDVNKVILDAGKLKNPPKADHAQVEHFVQNAVVGDMMEVDLFDGADSSLAGHGQADTGRRKCLLIGCSYSKLGGDWDLQGGPLRDIRRVRNWLENVWGFHTQDKGKMMMMADDHPQDPCKPTRGNILRAVEWLGRGAEPGDSLFVYFSGRGGTCPNPEAAPAFRGPRPFWYGIDSKKVDVVDLYAALLAKLPDGCRCTFLIDCANYHLWQPFYFDPTSLQLKNSSHPFYLPADIQVFSSIGHVVNKHGGRFTNTFLTLTSGQNIGQSYYDLLHKLNKALNEPVNLPSRMEEITGTRMNYFTCSQKSDLRRPFDLNSWAPNCNRQIGPCEVSLSHHKRQTMNNNAQNGPVQFKLQLQAAPNMTPVPSAPVRPNNGPQGAGNRPGNYGITAPKHATDFSKHKR